MSQVAEIVPNTQPTFALVSREGCLAGAAELRRRTPSIPRKRMPPSRTSSFRQGGPSVRPRRKNVLTNLDASELARGF
jgi:hypothetical protein